MRLTDEYGIRVDPRYRACNREALLSVVLFVAGAAASIGTIVLLTTGREPGTYGRVLGLPAYLFWGVVVVDLAFVAAAALAVRFVFVELPLEADADADAGRYGDRAGARARARTGAGAANGDGDGAGVGDAGAPR